jgi:predicted RNA-binding protein YlqC (UPF0109 family)
MDMDVQQIDGPHVEQEFLEFVVKSIVNHPENVQVERTVDDRGVLLTLSVGQDDMGYVIGRDGQTARALRILLKIVGAKANARVNMRIYEPESARREHQERKGGPAGEIGGEGMSASGSATPASIGHGSSGLVTDSDLSDLGI